MIEERECWDCRQVKPLSEWNFRKKRDGTRVPKSCKACHTKRAMAWRKKEPEMHKQAQARYAKRTKARAKAYRAVFEAKRLSDPDEIDALRRALADNPPAAATEGERLAYFRGFLAACKRSKDEESKLLTFQDLVFRIASELAAKRRGMSDSERFSYEEMVSWGYEAVLEVVRKKGTPSRSDVAGAIRHRIADAARAQFGRIGTPRRDALKLLRDSQGGALGEDGDEQRAIDHCGTSDPEIDDGVWKLVRSRAARSDVDPRIGEMLELRAEGVTFAKIGERFGITESRASQIFADHQEWMRRELVPLAAV